MKNEFIQILYNQIPIYCGIKDNQAYIQYCGKTYIHIENFLNDYPTLLTNPDLNPLSVVANFLFGGVDYSIIQDIPLYRKKYENKIKQEQSINNIKGVNLSQYGIFDTSLIHPPFLKDNTLFFFVESTHFGIPYQAICTLSGKGLSASCCYKLLSFNH